MVSICFISASYAPQFSISYPLFPLEMASLVSGLTIFILEEEPKTCTRIVAIIDGIEEQHHYQGGNGGEFLPLLSPTRKGRVAVLAAGTCDLPVAEEAVVTASLYGHHVTRLYDVGVAGIHRLLSDKSRKIMREADVLIVVAGMEGALPSVVAGLVDSPVVAVPTSVGYGASFNGVTPLLTMLSSCAPGIGVVNIDNGFGAAALACAILRLNPMDVEKENNLIL
jgi:phosphoribosylcarboxyaminoimidazole (NCAIR) mutase